MGVATPQSHPLKYFLNKGKTNMKLDDAKLELAGEICQFITIEYQASDREHEEYTEWKIDYKTMREYFTNGFGEAMATYIVDHIVRGGCLDDEINQVMFGDM